MPLHIDASIKAITELFPDYNLPEQKEIIAELEAWRTYIANGEKYAMRCDNLMTNVFEEVRSRADDGRSPALPDQL